MRDPLLAQVFHSNLCLGTNAFDHGLFKTVHGRELLRRGVGHLVEGSESHSVQISSELDIADACQSAHRVLFHLLESALADNVELPRRQLGREADVLSTAANREA